jgi:hypothetical protein
MDQNGHKLGPNAYAGDAFRPTNSEININHV